MNNRQSELCRKESKQEINHSQDVMSSKRLRAIIKERKTHSCNEPSNLFSKTQNQSRSVSSFTTRRKLLLSSVCNKIIKRLSSYKIPRFSKRTQGWALSRRYLYGDKIFGNLKFTNYVNDYLVSGQQHYPARVLLYTAIYIRVN